MEKNVLTGDRLLVNKFVFAPGRGRARTAALPERPIRRGDVLVFRYPEDPRRDFIKRVVALPGETVEIRDKRVFVDGRPLVEPYAFHADDAVWPDDPSDRGNAPAARPDASAESPRRRVFRARRQPGRFERQPVLGPGSGGKRPRAGALRLLVVPASALRRAERARGARAAPDRVRAPRSMGPDVSPGALRRRIRTGPIRVKMSGRFRKGPRA